MPMTLNGSGVHHITRVLSVSINTVLKVLRRQAAVVPEPDSPRVADVEVDEISITLNAVSDYHKLFRS